MLDSLLRPKIDPPLARLAQKLNRYDLTPHRVTWAGFVIGMIGAVCLSFQLYVPALALILINRLCDGLDGAIARERGTSSDLGGYLDIVLDFIVYSGVVFFFGLGHPDMAIYAAFLIFSFLGTGASFLAYAIIAGKRNISTEARGKKSFFHAYGLAEGTETIITLCLICLFPSHFQWIAIVFGAMCWITTVGRIRQGYVMFQD